MNETDIQNIGHFLLDQIPEEELLNLATLHSTENMEWKLSHFLTRRLSEWIVMAEANENDSKVMDFIATI